MYLSVNSEIYYSKKLIGVCSALLIIISFHPTIESSDAERKQLDFDIPADIRKVFFWKAQLPRMALKQGVLHFFRLVGLKHMLMFFLFGGSFVKYVNLC